MKWKVIVILFLAILFLNGSRISSESVHAQTPTDWRKGDYLISLLGDGDGKNRVFQLNTLNPITPEKEIRLFVNQQEVPSKEFYVNYDKHTIEIADSRAAPSFGAEVHMEYRIDPSFEWIEGDMIGTALANGDGETRIFKIHISNDIKLIESKTYLKINNVTIQPSNFNIDDVNRTITILPSIAAPKPGATIWFYYPVEARTSQTSASTPTEPAAPSFPGEMKVTAGGAITITINPTTASNAVYYFVISNENGKVVKKIKLNPQKPAVSPTLLISLTAGNYTLYVQQENGGTTLRTASVPWTVSGTPVGTTKTDTVIAPSFSIPSGVNFPGTITGNTNGSFTIRLTGVKLQSTESAYFIVKNINGQIVKRVLLNPASSFTATWEQLKLTTGGYYYYLIITNQSGNSAASIPQFISINNESAGQIQVLINGRTQSYEQPAVNVDGRVLVPLRPIFEALGAKVEWNGETQTVTATKGDKTIVLTIGSKVAYVNGKPVELDVPAQLINEKTMVPVRFVSEALGADVKWDARSQSVITFTAPQSIATTNESEGVQSATTEEESPILTEISNKINEPSDIVFVMDVTASMGETIDYVRESVKNFVDAVPSGSSFSVVAFRDILDPLAPELEYFDFTSDKNLLKANLDKLAAIGGGDLDESGLDAIDLAVSKLSNRSNPKRIIFITDAPVHDKSTAPKSTGFSLYDVNSVLQTNQITFDAIAPTDGLSYKQIKPLVDDNNGTLYDIQDATVLKLR